MGVDHKEFLNKAVFIPDLCEQIKVIMERYNIDLGRNAILVIITCLDDQCTTVIEYIKRELRKFHPKSSSKDDDNIIHIEKFYGMRLFGGIFIPEIKTYESLLPAAHHIPEKEKGNLLILNFSHIGYDYEKKHFGKLVRYGHINSTHACGAIKSLYERIINKKDMPIDADLKALSNYLQEIVKTYNIKKQTNGLDILQLTIKAYEHQIPWLKGQLKELSLLDRINIIYIGGIEIDMSKTCEEMNKDKVVIIEKFIIDNTGTVEII